MKPYPCHLFPFKKEKVLDIIAFQSSDRDKPWRKSRGKNLLEKIGNWPHRNERIVKMGAKEGKSGVIAAVKNIKEAEEKARRIIQEAREKEASKVIQEAYDEAKKIKESSLKEARTIAYEKKKTIVQNASKEAMKIRGESEEDEARMRERAEKAMSKAVEKVADKIKHFFEGGKL